MGNIIDWCKNSEKHSKDDYKLSEMKESNKLVSVSNHDSLTDEENFKKIPYDIKDKRQLFNEVMNQKDLIDINEEEYNGENYRYQYDVNSDCYVSLGNHINDKNNYRSTLEVGNKNLVYEIDGYNTAPIKMNLANANYNSINKDANENFATFGGEKSTKNENKTGLVLDWEISEEYKASNLYHSYCSAISENNLKFFVYINTEHLNLLINRNRKYIYEEFSTFYKPFLEISVTNTKSDPIIVALQKLNPEEENKVNNFMTNVNLNPSFSSYNTNLTDVDNSMIGNNQLDKSYSSYTTKKHPKSESEKILNFRRINCICINSDTMRYQNLLFSLKNGFIKTDANDDKDYPNTVTIGEGFIPINFLSKKYRDECFFDGFLEIKLRNMELLGVLKLKIVVSERILQQGDEKFEKFYGGLNKILDLEAEVIDQSHNSLNNTIHSNNNIKNIFPKYVKYSDLDPFLILKYFLHNNKNDDEIIFAENIIKSFYSNSNTFSNSNSIYKNFELSEVDLERFYKIYQTAVETKNMILVYQILIILCEISDTLETDLFYSIEKFFTLLNEQIEEKKFFFEIHKKFYDNIYIIKHYVAFLSNYERFYKTNKLSYLKYNKNLEDKQTIKIIFEILSKITEMLKANESKEKTNLPGKSLDSVLDLDLEIENTQEIKDCTMMCLNVLSLMVSQNKSNKIKKEDRIIENTIIYNNSISVISSRNNLLKLINKYINDSQIIGLIFKILRKSLQVVTNNNLTLNDLKNFKIEPKEFAGYLKKVLIEKGNGIFFTTLKIVLIKYHHYPELHANILAIIGYITLLDDNPPNVNSDTHESSLNQKFLKISASLLNLNLLKDIFESYRWRMKNFTYKHINLFHLNIISNFSDIAKCEASLSPESSQVLKIISSDLKIFYKNKIPKEKFKEILARKQQNLEFHSLICKVGANVTRSEEEIKNLMDSFFYEDVVEFLIQITSKHESRENKNGLKMDFLLRFREKKKNIPFEQIKKYVYIIVEKTAEIILNILVCSAEIIQEFMKKLNELNIRDLPSILELIKDSKFLLEKYGMSLSLSEDYIKRVTQLMESEDQ